MSNVYAMEPPTRGKVVMHTNCGDLEIELWPKETPRTCRNFVQLCLEGYYDDTPFNRIVKGYVMQGGDPTGTGNGGESIYGKPVRLLLSLLLQFPDEFHPRLRFSHRDTNTSQFFFALDKAEELTSRNTIFGKIVGDTIYNLIRISESETDKDERPLYVVKILSVEVLHNPFDDIVPRITPDERKEMKEKQRVEGIKGKDTKGKKDSKLLSFGNDEEEETFVFKKGVKSSHDLKGNAKLSNAPARDVNTLSKEIPISQPKEVERKIVRVEKVESEVSDESESETEKSKQKAYFPSFLKLTIRLITQNKINAMKKQITSIKVFEAPKPIEKKEKLTKSLLNEFSGKSKAIFGKRRKGGNEDDIMAKLGLFKQSLFSMKPVENVDEESNLCAIHGVNQCESCGMAVESDDNDVSGWMDQKLVFKKKNANVYEPKVDDYLFIDPRIESKRYNTSYPYFIQSAIEATLKRPRK